MITPAQFTKLFPRAKAVGFGADNTLAALRHQHPAAGQVIFGEVTLLNELSGTVVKRRT